MKSLKAIDDLRNEAFRNGAYQYVYGSKVDKALVEIEKEIKTLNEQVREARNIARKLYKKSHGTRMYPPLSDEEAVRVKNFQPLSRGIFFVVESFSVTASSGTYLGAYELEL